MKPLMHLTDIEIYRKNGNNQHITIHPLKVCSETVNGALVIVPMAGFDSKTIKATVRNKNGMRTIKVVGKSNIKSRFGYEYSNLDLYDDINDGDLCINIPTSNEYIDEVKCSFEDGCLYVFITRILVNKTEDESDLFIKFKESEDTEEKQTESQRLTNENSSKADKKCLFDYFYNPLGDPFEPLWKKKYLLDDTDKYRQHYNNIKKSIVDSLSKLHN